VEPRGQVGHEIVFVFTAAFADEAAHETGEQGICDLAAAGAGSPPLYPEGVADLAEACA
jgi:hypothetical protein